MKTIMDGFSRGYLLVSRYIPHDRHKKNGPALTDPYWKNQRIEHRLAEQNWRELMAGKTYEDVVVREKKNGK